MTDINNMKIKYTNTFEQFIEYCQEKLEIYFSEKTLCDMEKSLTVQRYEEEMKLLRKQVEEDEGLVKALWVAAFLRELQKIDIIVSREVLWS